jgi:hypothetical protein
MVSPCAEVRPNGPLSNNTPVAIATVKAIRALGTPARESIESNPWTWAAAFLPRPHNSSCAAT